MSSILYSVRSYFCDIIDLEESTRLCIFFVAAALFLERSGWLFNPGPVWDYQLAVFVSLLSAPAILFKKTERFFPIFVLGMLYITFFEYRSSANHVLLSLWLLVPLMFFPWAIKSEKYADYIRRSVGLVMVAAASQKLISGNFLNGHMLMYLASHGGQPEETFFSLVCSGGAYSECDPLVFFSILSVVWQYIIGFLLLFNCRHILALIIELGFVLGVGLATDEMNFQTMNVASLLAAFRMRLYPIVFVFLAGLLLVDHVSIINILNVILL